MKGAELAKKLKQHEITELFQYEELQDSYLELQRKVKNYKVFVAPCTRTNGWNNWTNSYKEKKKYLILSSMKFIFRFKFPSCPTLLNKVWTMVENIVFHVCLFSINYKETKINSSIIVSNVVIMFLQDMIFFSFKVWFWYQNL